MYYRIEMELSGSERGRLGEEEGRGWRWGYLRSMKRGIWGEVVANEGNCEK